MSKKISIGILGTASIANAFMTGQKTLQSCEVHAIASRDLNKSKAFAEKWGIPKFYGSYQELLDDPVIDLVYIPLPTAMHKEWTIKCAKQRKHVLCEKPLAPTYEDAVDMVKACLEHNVQFMDGTYWTHAQRTKVVQQHFPETGGVTTVACKFTWAGVTTDNIRRNMETEPLGSMGDLGWYCSRAILYGYAYQLPNMVFGISHKMSPHEPDFAFAGIMWYENGRRAHFDSSFGEATRQWVEFSGMDGAVTIDDFVLPWNSRRFEKDARDPEGETNFSITKFPGKSRVVPVAEPLPPEAQMIEDMCNIIRSGKIDHFWLIVALKTHLLVTLCLESAKKGVPVSVPHFTESESVESYFV